MSVLDTVQETLFQQFLAGSDLSRRLQGISPASPGGADADAAKPAMRRVEDLPWWKYQRSVALWYCEWLDTYYDSGDRCFLWRDELTQGFEAAKLSEIKDLAERMRLELPEHQDDEEVDSGTTSFQQDADPEVQRGPQDSGVVEDDGDWHVTAALTALADAGSGADDSSVVWQDDGQGNWTHWAAEVSRLFLWQDRSEVLYEYVQANGSSPRWVAKWSLAPTLVVALLGEKAAQRVVGAEAAGASSLELGSEPKEEPNWQLVSLQPRHARIFREGSSWWLEAFADALLNGQRLHEGATVEIPSRVGIPSLLRLGTLELLLDVPTTGAAPDTAPPNTAPSKPPGVPGGAVLQRDFVPKEEDAPLTPSLSGTSRARALNGALRRLVCGGTGLNNEVDRRQSFAREQRYEDRAEKRRKLHPVEWKEDLGTVAAKPVTPATTVEEEKAPVARRFTEKEAST